MPKAGLFLLLTALLLTAWSYVLADPNLVLINSPFFWNWQTWAWSWRGHWTEVTAVYVLLVLLWWCGLAWLIRTRTQLKPTLWVWVLAVILLLLGHNALSHDIFNYLFNAKMVVEYGGNPHQQVALDFAYDPWVRFMHNTHTAAPYGYVWTALSLIPYSLSFGVFFLAYMGMKVWMLLGLGLLLWAVWQLLRQSRWPDKLSRWMWLAFHPLLLWETLLNGHNDVWMMWPVMMSFWLLTLKRKAWQYVAIILLLILSVNIKFASILLVPLFLAEAVGPVLIPRLSPIIKRLWTQYQAYKFDLAGLLMLIPLFTSRSQQFHPWYLIWSLSFTPLMKSKLLRVFFLTLSFTSQLRYLPWLLNGLEYTDQVQLQMRIITWSAVVIFPVLWVSKSRLLPQSK